MHFQSIVLAASGLAAAAVSAMAAPAPVPGPHGVKHLQASRRDIVERKEIRQRYGKRAAQQSNVPNTQCGQTGNFLLRTTYPTDSDTQGQFLKLNNPDVVQNTAVLVAAGLDNVAVWTLTPDCKLTLANSLGTEWTMYSASNNMNMFKGSVGGQIFTVQGNYEGTTKPICSVAADGKQLLCSAPDAGTGVSSFGVYSSGNSGDALVLSNAAGFETYNFSPTTLYMVTVA